MAEKLAVVKARAEEKGRQLEYGIRLHVIVRETEEEAWAAADKLIAHLDDDTIAQAQQIFARMDSTGQARMSALHNGNRDKLRIAPNLWRASGWFAAAQGPRWWEILSRLPNVSANIRRWESPTLFSPAIRIWKKRTASPSW